MHRPKVNLRVAPDANEGMQPHPYSGNKSSRERHPYIHGSVSSQGKFIELKRDVVDEDIRVYIHNRWSSDFQRWNAHPSLGEEVEKTLMKDAKGM